MAEATFSLNDIFSYIYGRGRIFSWWYLQMHLWQRPYFLLMISSDAFMTEAVFSLDDIFSCIYDRGRIFPWWYLQLHLWLRPYFPLMIYSVAFMTEAVFFFMMASVASISEAVFSLDDISSVKKTVTIEFRWIFVDGVEWMSYTLSLDWQWYMAFAPPHQQIFIKISNSVQHPVCLSVYVCVCVCLAGWEGGWCIPGGEMKTDGGSVWALLAAGFTPPFLLLLPPPQAGEAAEQK